MRNRILCLALLLSAGIAHAEAGKTEAFKCMNSETFEIDSACMVNTIGSNTDFQASQAKIIEAANENTGYAIATMTFDQEKMQIDIVAHRDALQAMNRLTNN
jgi:hypothetical protein